MRESYALIGPSQDFLIGGTIDEYIAVEKSLEYPVNISNPIVPTNTSLGWTAPLEYGSSDLIFKIADYIPRVDGSLEV